MRQLDMQKRVLLHWKLHGGTAAEVGVATGASERSAQRWIGEATKELGTKIKAFQDELPPIASCKKFIILSVVPDTMIDTRGYAALKHKAAKKGYRLIVVPAGSKEPGHFTKFGTDLSDMIFEDVDIGPRIRLMPSLRVPVSSQNPLTSKHELATNGKSIIIPHAKWCFTPMPTIEVNPSWLHTTTSISLAKDCYPKNTNGQRCKRNHTVGALLVEVRDGYDQFRQLCIDDDGGFYDIDGYWTADTHTPKSRVRAIVLGDVHAAEIDPVNANATIYAEDSLINDQDPENLITHDLHDNSSDSHHSKNRELTLMALHMANGDDLEEELRITGEFTLSLKRPGMKVYEVKSNHDEHLFQFLDRKPPENMKNREIYHRMWTWMCEEFRKTGKYPNPLEQWYLHSPKFMEVLEFMTFLPRDVPFRICGVELSNHGDKGFNGGKGSLKTFAKVPYPTIHGHAHTPGVDGEDTIQVGTLSKMKLSYVSGYSSWMCAHCIIYPNGKRQLICVINGQWR
jgi:hypothetical protein